MSSSGTFLETTQGRQGRSRRLRLPSRARLVYLTDVTLHLTRRDLALRYRGSLLGWLWALTPALLQLVVTQFLFTRVIPLGVANYPVFLLVGILAWTQFANGLRLGTSALEGARHLVLRPGFPTMLLPLVSVLVELVNYVIALPILFIALALTTGVTVESAFLPVLILIQVILVAGFVLLLAPAQLFFKDVRQIVALAVTLGFWLTPIFYKQRQVPEAFQPLYKLNPMAHLIEAQRSILLNGYWPSFLAVGLVGLVSVVILVVGFIVYAAVEQSLPEQL